MDCDALPDDQWERIKAFVPGGTIEADAMLADKGFGADHLVA